MSAGICGSIVGGGRGFFFLTRNTQLWKVWGYGKVLAGDIKHFYGLHKLENTDPNCLWMIPVVASLKYKGLITATLISKAKEFVFFAIIIFRGGCLANIFWPTTNNSCPSDISLIYSEVTMWNSRKKTSKGLSVHHSIAIILHFYSQSRNIFASASWLFWSIFKHCTTTQAFSESVNFI